MGKHLDLWFLLQLSGHLIPKTMLMNELNITLDELENEFLGDIQFAGTQESVVIGVSLEVSSGEFISVIGPSGAVPEINTLAL